MSRCNDSEGAFGFVPVSGSGSNGEEGRVEVDKCSLGDSKYLNSECANRSVARKRWKLLNC